ncbi:hypothetical protein [Cardinium endosymbiont of Tipula unca]|uniref:hypothetical protein n=1 Tax=Cardinium endosymbiont of Tipula unca TaxID=3066216 RepID=UPI0030CA856A
MLFCSIKGANRGYIQVLLATSRNRIYFRRRSIFCSRIYAVDVYQIAHLFGGNMYNLYITL